MTKRFLIILTTGLLFSTALLAAEDKSGTTSKEAPKAPPPEEDAKLVIEAASGAEANFTSLEDTVIAATHPSGVRATYKDVTLSADRLSVNRDTTMTAAEGNVRLQRGSTLWVGERLSYNFATGEMGGDRFKVGDTPFFASGRNLTGSKLEETPGSEARETDGAADELLNRVYTASDGMLTTDDVENPVYRVKAKTLIVFPGKRIAAYGATVYVGKVPIFYWPYYRRDYAERHPNNIELTPGFRSLYGPYILGSYNWQANTNLSGSINLDYRQKRGFGGGPDLNYDLGRFGSGMARFYMTRDDNAATNSLAMPIDSQRHRLQFTHRVKLRDSATARAVVNWQSDEFFLRDFFESQYRQDPQPKTFFELSQFWRNFSLNALAQPQVNDFFDTVERLPDVRLSGLPQQIGATPLYYESESSLGYFRHQFANNAFPEFAAWRGDSFHQIALPKTFFGWLNVKPRIGGRYTHYGESEGPGIPFSEEDRFVFNTGAEMSFKASRVFPKVESRLLDIHELRHILEPSVNYVYVPSPSEIPPNLPQFDTRFPTFRLLPLEYPQFNSIDAVDSENTIRFGLRNTFQTKRNDRVEDVLSSSILLDWHARRRPDQQTFSDAFTTIDFQPRNWLSLTSSTRYDIDNGVFQQSDNYMTFEPGNIWSFSVGHRYIRDIPVLGPDSGANAIYGTFYLRFNEDWGLRTQHLFEAREGRLQEQYYTLYRDLRSWTTALTFRVRNSSSGREDYTIAATFSLKAFPRFGLGDDRVSPSLLVGQ